MMIENGDSGEAGACTEYQAPGGQKRVKGEFSPRSARWPPVEASEVKRRWEASSPHLPDRGAPLGKVRVDNWRDRRPGDQNSSSPGKRGPDMEKRAGAGSPAKKVR